MSTLKTTFIQHPSAANVGIQLESDGSVVLDSIPVAIQSAIDDAIVAIPGIGSNVVSVNKTDVFTSTSTSYVDVTGFSATITPSSATSKVLVVAYYVISNRGSAYLGNNRGAYSLLVRNTSDVLLQGDAASNRVRATYATSPALFHDAFAASVVYLDSPATISPTSYKVQIRTGLADTVVFNRTGSDVDNANGGGRSASSITLIEVAV